MRPLGNVFPGRVLVEIPVGIGGDFFHSFFLEQFVYLYRSVFLQIVIEGLPDLFRMRQIGCGFCDAIQNRCDVSLFIRRVFDVQHGFHAGASLHFFVAMKKVLFPLLHLLQNGTVDLFYTELRMMNRILPVFFIAEDAMQLTGFPVDLYRPVVFKRTGILRCYLFRFRNGFGLYVGFFFRFDLFCTDVSGFRYRRVGGFGIMRLPCFAGNQKRTARNRAKARFALCMLLTSHGSLYAILLLSS